MLNPTSAGDQSASEGQMGDYKGAHLIVNELTLTKYLLGDRG